MHAKQGAERVDHMLENAALLRRRRAKKATGYPKGRPPSENPRVLSCRVSFSPEEWLILDQYAARTGYGAPRTRLARFLRACALARARPA